VLKHLQSREDWNEKSLTAKGFTLVELLVVIVILGILAAVVVFAVSGITDTAADNACQSEVRTVRTAVEAYKADNELSTGAGIDTDTLVGTGDGKYLTSDPEYVTVSGGVLSLVSGAPDGCSATD
jgi:general secretion pathway protein G